MLASEIEALIALFHQHGEYMAVLIWALSALVQAIPTPGPDARATHVFLFNVAHFAAGNLRVLGKRRPRVWSAPRTVSTRN